LSFNFFSSLTMYPGHNNFNNPYPPNHQYQEGYNMPMQPGYPSYPNQNTMGFGPQIGFNIGQPEHNQPQGYGTAPNPQFGMYNQQSNIPPHQQQMPGMHNPQSNFSSPNQMYGSHGQPPHAGIPNVYPNQDAIPARPAPPSNQVYPQMQNQGYPGQPSGYQNPYSVSTPHAPGSNWSQGHGAQQPIQNYPNTGYVSQPGGNVHQETRVDNIGASGEIYRGTIKPALNFNAEQDCNVLRKAMKGIGTDEKSIIECLGRRCLAQRLEIKKTFKTMFGKDLIDELKSELSGDFCRAVVESLFDQDYYDAYSLRKAMEGAGTRESTLTEILVSRTNQQIENIKILYKKLYNKDLEKDVVSETSGFYKRVLVSCLQANKSELSSDQLHLIRQGGHASIINMNQARQEAQELYSAGEKKLGTDEACFIKIFALRNKYQLRATFDEYQKLVGRDIFNSIDREMSGDLASALKAVAMQAVNAPSYFATRLQKSMKGAGTNDNTLIRILITRSEIDLENIKVEFHKQFGKPLDSFVRADTSGDYQKFLMRFVEGN